MRTALIFVFVFVAMLSATSILADWIAPAPVDTTVDASFL